MRVPSFYRTVVEEPAFTTVIVNDAGVNSL